MAQTTKRYLDLEGLRYVLGKLSYTKPENETGKFLIGLTEKNGVITGTWADLASSDIPKLGTPTGYSAVSALNEKVATFTHTITRDAGDALTANVKIGVKDDLTIERGTDGQITIGYKAATVEHPVLGVVENGYLTLGTTDKLLNIDTNKIAADSKGTKTNLASVEFVNEKILQTVTSAVTYKGTTNALPTGDIANGDMYKVIGDGFKVGDEDAKAGDTIIYYVPEGGTGEWQRIPSGDDDVVTTFAGKTGDITVASGSTTLGDVNFALGDDKKLTGSVAGLNAALTGKQDTITDGSATIASVTDDVVTIKAGVAQTAGAISNNANADIVLAKVAKTGAAGDVTVEKIAGVNATDVQAAIAELHAAIVTAEAAGVQSIDGKKGAIELDKTSATNGSVKFAWDAENKQLLKASVTLPTATATVVTADNDLANAAFTGDATAKITIANVKETNGEISADATDGVVMQTITANEIDALFTA